jgi:hypothetical protein
MCIICLVVIPCCLPAVCLVSIFHHDSSQRQGLLDELLNSTIAGISSAKNPPRHCPVKLDGNKHIQMCSALIIQLVQVGHAAHDQSLYHPCMRYICPAQHNARLCTSTCGIAASCIASVLRKGRSAPLQGSATVPPPGTAAADVLNSFGWAHTWADKILASLLDKLPLAKATKSDTSTDFKQIMENLITGKWHDIVAPALA